MRIKLFLILFAIASNAIAQREADCLVNGRCLTLFGVDCTPPEGNSVFKFNADSLESINESPNFRLATNYSRAAFSDNTTGDFLFASNGWRLVNSQGDILANKLWRADIPWPNDNFDTTMVLNSLGPLFLNDPGDSTKAYLFYGQYSNGNFGPEVLKADLIFTYAYLDIPTQSLISKNNELLNEISAPGDMQACRHANGRDWWIIKPGSYEDEYFIGLLSPLGIQLEKITIPGIQHRGQFETYSYFNKEGTKFIHFTGKRYKYLHEYNFDRCSGSLSNTVIHDLSDSLLFGDVTSCTISPDGSKFYIRRSFNADTIQGTGGMLQYDLENGNFELFTEIGSSPQLSPNYRNIFLDFRIIQEDTMIRTLSVINNPNGTLAEIDLELNKYIVINYPMFGSPSNFANFRLGKLVGSPCDTIPIGLQAIVPKGLQFGLFPNPSNGEFSISLPKDQQLSWELSNTLGQKVSSGAITAAEANYSIPNTLTNGLYVLSLVNEFGEIVGVKKLIMNKE